MTGFCETSFREALDRYCPQILDVDGAVRVLDEVDSTSSVLLRAISAGETLSIVVARAQTAGRGRQGNGWYSLDRGNLYLSVRMDIRGEPESRLPAVPLAAGVAAATVLRESGVMDVQLKWPNDILVRGRKFGGILCEAVRIRRDATTVVVGMGLNIGNGPFPDELRALAIHGGELGLRLEREALAAKWVHLLWTYCERLEKDPVSTLVTQWIELGEPFGRRVRSGVLDGVTVGLNSVGRLLIRTDDGTVVDIPGGVVETMD